MSFIEGIKERAKEKNCRIVLPESYDPRVCEAARMISEEGLCRIILFSEDGKEFPDPGVTSLPGIEVVDYQHSPNLPKFAEQLYELRKHKGMTPEKAAEQVLDPMFFGTMMMYNDEADGMVAGAIHSTADTMRPALQIIKTAPGIHTVSSYIVEVVPDCELGDDGIFLFSDPAVVEFPTEDQLVDIAVASAKTFETLTGHEPIVALLSYSSKGSAKNERLQYIINAATRLKEEYPNLKTDGELQLDAAIVPSVAELKAKGSPAAGHANVLIFPDLNAGNIGYKLVQRLAKAEAYGPVMQGLKKPINDLSRGCFAEDIVGTVALTCLQV